MWDRGPQSTAVKIFGGGQPPARSHGPPVSTTRLELVSRHQNGLQREAWHLASHDSERNARNLEMALERCLP